MDTSTIRFLSRVALFAALNDHQLIRVAERSRRRKIRSGIQLFHEGDVGRTLYIIVAGYVNIQTSTATGETVHIATRGAGEHFGEMALIDGQPRMADAVTASECELIVLDNEEFVNCIKADPEIALAVMASLASKLREAKADLASQQELGVMGRISLILLRLAHISGTPEPSGGIRLAAGVTQQSIADQAAATRESVNRAIAQLKVQNIVRMHGRVLVIQSPERLRGYCDR